MNKTVSLLAVVLATAADLALAQTNRRLTDEECYRISIQEGAAAERALSGRESAEDRGVAAIRRALRLPSDIPDECNGRANATVQPRLPISEQEAERVRLGDGLRVIRIATAASPQKSTKAGASSPRSD